MDLAARVAGNVLRDASLFFDKIIDGVLELRGFGLPCIECQLGQVLLIELIGARSNDAVIRTDRTELLIKGHELLLLSPVADRIQVFGNLTLGGVDKVAQWLQPVRIVDERCFCQKPGEKVRLGFRFQKPAQVFEPCRGRQLPPAWHSS